MIELKTQLFSLGFSFLYGIFFGIFVKINHSLLFNLNRGLKIAGTLFVMLDMSLLYFVGIRFINHGIIHIYFFIMFLVGWSIIFLILLSSNTSILFFSHTVLILS